MIQQQIRPDDFETRRKHLENLDDQQLKQYFWELAEKAISPLIDLARTHTSPAIERSVLLRMGFSSLEAKAIVEKTINRNLIGKGAGHVVYRLSRIMDIPVREAGLKLIDDKGWDQVKASFKVQK